LQNGHLQKSEFVSVTLNVSLGNKLSRCDMKPAAKKETNLMESFLIIGFETAKQIPLLTV
jgi:hypothetical protein